MAKTPPTSSLCVRSRSGSEARIATLYDRYAGVLNQLGRRILRDPPESEDVVHEVFVELWQRAVDYDPERGSVRTWIMRRMRSRCLDRFRSARMTRSVALAPGDIDRLGEAAPDESSGPDWARLRTVMSQLPPPQREVLELGYFEGLSCSEIAERPAVPIGTVKSRVAAALDKLRGSMHEVGKSCHDRRA